MAVYELTFVDFLYIEQTIESTPKAASVQHSWSAAQTIYVNRKSGSVEQTFNIYQTIEVRTSIKNLTVSQFLPFYQDGGPTEFQTVTQFFHMWQECKVIEYEAITQTLVINQSIDVTVSKGVYHTLEFTQTIVCNGVWNREVVDTFSPASSVNAYTGDKYGSAIALPTLSGPNSPEC